MIRAPPRTTRPDALVPRTRLVRALGRQRRDLPEAMVREEVMRCGNEALEGLRVQLGALEVIGSVSPLLGLFGTVLGMIEAFRQLAEAGSQVSPAILSAGIWEALLTTAVGLAVAIDRKSTRLNSSH